MLKEAIPERNWWVITGADYSGKTTVIRALAAQGLITLPEQAAELMSEYEASGMTVEEMLADQESLQYGILDRKIAAEASHDPVALTFADRGLPDTLGFLNYYGVSVKPQAREAIMRASYRGVFFFEQLPLTTFTPDFAHSEGSDFMARIGGFIHDAYVEFGFEPIRVPVMSVAERVAFVLHYAQGS
jgi:predicted ATPase